MVCLNDQTALHRLIDERLVEPAAYMEVAAMTGPAAGFRRSRRAWMPGVGDASLRAPGRNDGAAQDRRAALLQWGIRNLELGMECARCNITKPR